MVGTYGTVFTNWKNQRQFTLQTS